MMETQESQRLLALTDAQVEGIQTNPTWCWPVGQVMTVEGEVHIPLLSGEMLMLAQV